MVEIIIADSREQRNENILQYFERHGIEHRVAKVDTGDYMDTDNPTVRVERKMSLAELAHNLLSKDKARFYREVRRAREEGIKLIILCEQGGIRSIQDVMAWNPKYGKVSGKTLAEAIFRLEIGYGVPVYYCSRKSTGKRIVELLSDEEGERYAD